MSAPAADPPDTRDDKLPDLRAIVAVDIENSTALTNVAKAERRQVMYTLFEDALRAGGIDERCRDPLVDRGDGVLALVHATVRGANVLLLSAVIPTLNRLLIEHGGRCPDQHLRLRAVLHAGQVHRDARGSFGMDLDLAFRLLDARRLKKVLREEPEAHMIIVVSNYIYQTIVEQGYPGIDQSAFTPLGVRVGGNRRRGWVQVPHR
ncbi:MAG TPA: hypothetical protein VGR06_29950 [Actinophytocola sp.]|jgi:class 3 adenylate cyclase|uniref:hypothetical protein n=1 Tax=Actinophytocola sp. TaxID=1872138 RepID=UPI002E0AB021|nr:hypothetical protein [Actinophytocola sp.]